MSNFPPIDINAPDVLSRIRQALDIISRELSDLSTATKKTKIADYREIRTIGLPTLADVTAHSARHQNGGSDEISVAGLSGELADAQTPKSHSNTSHSTAYQATSEKNAASGYAGLSAASRITKGADVTDDLIVDLATKGLVLKDTQATPHYWRITISNVGAIVITDVGTSKP